MISTCAFYNDFKGANNTWQNGHFRPQSFVYALHEAQMEIFITLRREWEKSQVITDDLRPFFKSVQVPIKDFKKAGIVFYPADYSRFSNLRFFSKKSSGPAVMCSDLDILEADKTCRALREEEKAELLSMDELIERSITKISNDSWGSAISDEFIPPTNDNPYSTQTEKGFKVVPKTLGYVVLDYLAVPERPIFLAKNDAKHNVICLPGCTNILWGDEMLPELMSRVKTKYSSFISNPQKYAEAQKETSDVGA